MTIWMGRVVGIFLLTVSATFAQTSSEPFPSPIAETEGVITVGIEEFASLPDVDGEAARMMHFLDEPETGRLFVSDMRGLVYSDMRLRGFVPPSSDRESSPFLVETLRDS